MPQVIPFMAGALGIGAAGVGVGAAAGWAAGAAFAATTLGGIAVNLLASVSLSALSMALQGKPKAQVAGLRTDQTLGGGVNPETFILGRFATNGALAAPYMSHGQAGKTPNAFLNYVIELGGIPGQTLRGLILNGEEVELLGDRPHADYGQRIGGRYEGRAWIRYYDGRQTAADPMLMAKYPAPHVRPWSADMVGQGICYAVLTFQYDRKVFQGWPTVRFVLDGIPLYDPRRDSTQAGGLGPQRWSEPATWAVSHNPAVQIYNIMRGIRLPGGQIWGGDIPAEDLPLERWKAAMAAGDVLASDGASGTEPLYRAGLEVVVEDEPWSVIEELLAACSGALAETGGVWTLRAGVPGLPVMVIHDDDLLADAADDFKPFPTLDAIYNAIEATYPDPESGWESRDADPITHEAWEAEDGGRRLTASLALPAVPYPVQVQRLMSALIKDHRRMRSHVVVLPPEAVALEALDVIAWTSPSNGYAAKLFEVKTSDRDVQTGRTTVALREIDPEDYDPPSGLARPAPPDRRPLLPAAQAVPGWTVAPWRIKDASGADRRPGVRLSWDAEGADDARGIRFAIRLGGETSTGSETALHDHRSGVAEIELLPATVYEVRARFVIDHRPTNWSGWVSVLTPDLRIGTSDVTKEVADWLAAMHGWIDSGLGPLPDLLSDMAQAARGLRDELRAVTAEVLELGAQDHVQREELRRSLSAQMGGMGARFDERIVVLASSDEAAALRITSLEAGAGATNARIDSEQLARSSADAALALSITSLEADLGEKASAQSMAVLEGRVTDAEGTITSQGSAITSLTTTINDPSSGLGSKLAASAIGSYYTKSQTDGAISTATASATQGLKRSLEGNGGSIKAAQDAAQAASDLAGGKGKVIMQSAAPAAADRLAQNLWIDTTGNANTPKRWSGSAWVAVTDKVASDAAAAAANALAVANTKASAQAVSDLTTRVSSTEGDIDALADLLQSLETSVGRMSASGRIRMTTEANASGASSTIGLKATATAGEANGARSAAMFLEARTDGTSRVLFEALQFVIKNGSSRTVPFRVEGGRVYIDNAMITDLTADKIRAGTIRADLIEAQGITRQGVAGSGPDAVTNNSSSWTQVCAFTLTMPFSGYMQGSLFCRWTDKPSTFPTSFEGRVTVNGTTRIALPRTTLVLDDSSYVNWPFTEQALPSGVVTVVFEIRNAGGKGVQFSNLSAIAAMR